MSGGRPVQAFYSTRQDASAEHVMNWYARRWSIEVTFQNPKTHLGFEQPQGWTRYDVERIAPTAMLLYSLIVLWFTKVGHRRFRRPNCPWYSTKRHASFVDMLATLKRESVHEQVLSTPPRSQGLRKLHRILLHALQPAA